MNDQSVSPEITSDDKLWALLAYIFSPLVPVIILLMEDKKNRPFLKAHNIQALILGLIAFVLAVSTILACLSPIVWLVALYYGIQAYQGKFVEIPVITNFVKNQGWA
jgi:uncharacterized membrane protein